MIESITPPLKPQSIIQESMQQICFRGNYEMVHLFSSEGLPIAEYYHDQVIDQDRLAELSLLLRNVKQMADVMAGISSLKEMIVEGFNKRKIIFRFFTAFDQEVVLAAVVPPDRAYRGLTNRLIKMIEELKF